MSKSTQANSVSLELLDYAVKVEEEVEDDLSPVLVAWNHNKRALWTFEVDHKGADAGVGAN